MTHEPLRRMNPTDDDLTRASSVWTASRLMLGLGAAGGGRLPPPPDGERRGCEILRPARPGGAFDWRPAWSPRPRCERSRRSR